MKRPLTLRTSGTWRRKAALGSVVVALLQSPGWGAAPSPNRLLQLGRFREAQQAFEAMAERQPTDPRWRYNAGVAAFKAGDAATAQKHFEAATAAPDLDLQRKAWYNLGNAAFSLATAPGAEETEKTLQAAAEAFGAALQLDPKDHAASENLSAVRQFAEELKKQQEQQSQEGDSDSKDSKDKKGQDKKDQKNQPGQKGQKGQKGKQGQDSPKESPENAEDDSSQDPNEKSDQEQASKSKDSKKPKDSKGKQNSADARDGDSKKDPAGDDAQKQQAAQPTNSPAGGSPTNQLSQAGSDKEKEKDKGKAGAKPSDIQRAGGNEAAGAEGDAGESLEEDTRMTVVQAQQMLDSQKGAEKPIWTLVRGWGQDKPEGAKSSGRRKNW